MREPKKNDCEVFPVIVPVPSGLKSINFFLYKMNQSVTLIDAGLDNQACWEALITTLVSNGFTLKDLTQIVLTHHHIDHVGLVNRIVSNHPIPVYAHSDSIPRLKRENDFLQQRVEFFSKLYEEMGCGEDGQKQVNYLKESIVKNKSNTLATTIHTFESSQFTNIDIIEVPGHAPDQVAFYDKRRKWLVSGDLLMNHISSNAFVEPDQSGQRMLTLIDHISSLKKCLSLPVDLVYPGHGPLIKQPKQLIKKRLVGIDEKANRLLKLIQSGISTGNELAKTYYEKIYHQQFSLVMSEIIGHLDYLETQGKIKKDLINGVWHYSV